MNVYIVNGFTMDDDRLKNLGGGDSKMELSEKIQELRKSRKMTQEELAEKLLYPVLLFQNGNLGEVIRV